MSFEEVNMMTRKTLETAAHPRTTLGEANQIDRAAKRRREQMLPGEGPAEPDKEDAVSHFKGDGDPIALGPVPTQIERVDEEPD
tara:strand:+ start:120 stop:371 length:252 start_codon:yes stop_codon:yes gene_type:complete